MDDINKCYGDMSDEEVDVDLEFGSKSTKDEEGKEEEDSDDGILVSDYVLHSCE